MLTFAPCFIESNDNKEIFNNQTLKFTTTMRKLFMCVLLLAGTLTLQAQIKIGKMKIDTKKAIQAGKDAAGAITLSDEDIANMSQEYIQWMDTHNKVASPDSELGKRLAKITANFPKIEGLKLNFAIYEVVDVFNPMRKDFLK